MRWKFCGIRDETGLQRAVEAGVDAVGFQVGQLYCGKSFILPSTAGRLAEMLPPMVMPFLVTHYTDYFEIVELVERSEIRNLELHFNQLETLGKLRDMVGRTAKIIVTLYPDPTGYLELPVELYAVADAVMVDPFHTSVAAQTPDVAPDWNFLRAFREKLALPLILSGPVAVEQAEAAGIFALNRIESPVNPD